LKTCINYRDLKIVKNIFNTNGSVEESLTLLSIKFGLFPDEYNYLDVLCNYGTMSIKHVASVLCLDPETVERVEHRLLKRGLIKITSKGRQLSDKLLNPAGMELQNA
jgi:Holliday junction resolvasome RuvABC ATP-dependent DNA helicase subunit